MASKKRAVLFANGTLEQTGWLNGYLLPEDFLVAVDGGYYHLKRLDLTPHLLIGDLDSIGQDDLHEIEQADIEIMRFPPEKDQTDLQLALEIVHQRGFKRIVVAAATGGRLDQTLANIFLLNHPVTAGCDVRLENGSEEVFIIRRSGIVQGEAGETVSLLPIGAPAMGVTTEGLVYPLHGETLYPNQSRGISNVLSGSRAQITITGGMLLCVHLRKNG